MCIRDSIYIEREREREGERENEWVRKESRITVCAFVSTNEMLFNVRQWENVQCQTYYDLYITVQYSKTVKKLWMKNCQGSKIQDQTHALVHMI